jgi:hypothetical protein
MHLRDSLIGEFGAAIGLRSNGTPAEALEAKINAAFLVLNSRMPYECIHDR